MAKKKHKKKNKEKGLFHDVDKVLSTSYEDILDEIEEMQLKLDRADRKAKKKNEESKKGVQFYTYDKSIKARKKMVQDWEETCFLDRVAIALEKMGPVISIIARLVTALIVAFLSIDAIKKSISPKTLRAIDKIYTLSTAF